MAKTEVTGVQVQMAAAAGVKLLSVDDLPVPLSVAKSGALGILDGVLQALANGDVVLTPPPPPQKEAGSGKKDKPPKGDLRAVKSSDGEDKAPAE